MSCRPCSRHKTHPGRRTTKQTAPAGPHWEGRIFESGSAGEGVTVSLIVRGVKRAEESSAVAAVAAWELRMVRVGTAMARLLDAQR